jgi:hypothetical protein
VTSLIDLATYQRLSKDTESIDDDVLAALDDAQRSIEDALHRKLSASGSFTELLRPDGRGRVFPKLVPVSSVSAPAGASISSDGWSVVVGAVWPEFDMLTDRCEPASVSLTYQGGFTLATLPIAIRNGIITVAAAQLQPALAGVPVGALMNSVSVGDASVSFAVPVAGDPDSMAQALASGSLRGWVRRVR